MKKQFYAAVVVSAMLFVLSAVPAFAYDDQPPAYDNQSPYYNDQPPAYNNQPDADPAFEQKVTKILQKIDDNIALLNDRISRVTDARACVNAVGRQSDLIACRNKYQDLLHGTPPIDFR